MDFAGMTLATVEEFGAIVLAKLTEVERQREQAIEDATMFIYKVRELPDVAPLPESFFSVVALVQQLKYAAA